MTDAPQHTPRPTGWQEPAGAAPSDTPQPAGDVATDGPDAQPAPFDMPGTPQPAQQLPTWQDPAIHAPAAMPAVAPAAMSAVAPAAMPAVAAPDVPRSQGPQGPTPYASSYQGLPALPEHEPDAVPASRNLPAPRRALSRPWVVQLIAVVLLILLWQYLTSTNDRIPSIYQVLRFMAVEITGGSHGGVLVGEFWSPLGLSLQRYAVGLVVGIPIGAVLGLLIGSSNWARGLLNDTTLVLLAMPAVAWAFLASLWFGLSSTAPVVAVALTVVPFVAINLSTGVRNIDPALIEMTRTYKVSRRNRVMDLLLGGTRPNAFTGVRLAFTTGWNSLLIVEWFSATDGVGWRARFWYDALRFPGFVGWVFLFVLLIGVLDRLVLRRLERRALRWNQRPALTFADDWAV